MPNKVPHGFKLGLQPKRVDTRTLSIEKYLSLSRLPPPPDKRYWICGVTDWGMLLNDRIGDCAIAAPLHQEMTWTACTKPPFVATDAMALTAYEKITGYNPANPATDRGSVLLDVMNYWRQQGIGGRRILGYAEISNLQDHATVCSCVNLFGGLILGVALPLGAQQEPEIWKAPSRYHQYGIWAPGSWGGHAIQVIGFSPYTITFISWGQVMKMTWNFWDSYVNQAFVALSNDWVTGVKKAPNGFDFKTLEADLGAVT